MDDTAVPATTADQTPAHIEDIQGFVGKELLMWVNTRPTGHRKTTIAFAADNLAEGPEAVNLYATVKANHPGAAVRFLGVGLQNNVIAESRQDRIFVHMKPVGWNVKVDRPHGKAQEKFRITRIQVRPGVRIQKAKKESVPT
jgi:hypothetical protein